MNANPDQLACYPTTRTPPIGVPLAIYARSTDGFSEWFEGDYDGRHWRAHDMPATPPEWYVRGWREINAPLEDDSRDCRRLGGPPNAGEPLLVHAN